MLDQINKYSQKLINERMVFSQQLAFSAQDDVVVAAGNNEFAQLTADIIAQLNCMAIVCARPSLPFAEYLIKRSPPDEKRIIPRDTETRTFLHDIPIIRQSKLGDNLINEITSYLASRKGVIVEGIGIIANGSLTVEQAYINWSSIFHSTFIKYLEDLLAEGFKIKGEAEDFRRFRDGWLQTLSTDKLEFKQGPFYDKQEILSEIGITGRYTVQSGLVDSFFGNISYSDESFIYISQTASSLDELDGCIDPVPYQNSSTVGITASSELAAHRGIYETTKCRTILHGHPRFSVMMSMMCPERNHCPIRDCWKECRQVRMLGNTPVVAGEIGAGGLAATIAPVIGKTGRVIVYGHGVFSTGKSDFKEAFTGLIDVENWCRDEYFRLFDAKHPTA